MMDTGLAVLMFIAHGMLYVIAANTEKIKCSLRRIIG